MICLVGFMGAGKSTALRALSRTGLVTVDLDELIEQREGASIESLFADLGEDRFREIEAGIAIEALSDTGTDALALGGGSVLSEEVREALAGPGKTVVWLSVGLEEAWTRAEGSRRPLARDRDAFSELFHERQPLYREVSDGVVVGAARDGIVGALPALELFGSGLEEGTRMIWLGLDSGSHPILVGPGLDLGKLLAPGTPLAPGPGRSVLVWDSNVASVLGARFDGVIDRIEVGPGEESKSLPTAEEVLRQIARGGVSRSDRVLAVGGGVVGDLAGFCAATYQRGIDLVQVPTSLVAQVDSAYGGKTAVDLPEGKNYVGAFHQPVSVVADTSLLSSLPEEELAAGMAEVIKTGLLAGGTLWQAIRDLDPGEIRSRPDVIFECALHKCEVVASDEFDGGVRATLNLGHTVGHAIEAATGYRRYRHGEAVALGLLAALELSGADDLRSEVEELNERHGLPVNLDPGVGIDEVETAVSFDKKKTEQGIGFVLLEEPGSPRTGEVLAGGDVRTAIEGLLP